MIIVAIVFFSVCHSSVISVNFITVESKICPKLTQFESKKNKIIISLFRWFVIKDSYITYIRPDTYEVRFPMLVDRAFEIASGFRHAGTHHGIKITNLQRTLVLKCRTTRDCEEWTQHLMNLKEQASGFVSATASRFNSFAPVRRKQLAYW